MNNRLTILAAIVLATASFSSCKQDKTSTPPRDPKQYTIEQFYKTKSTGAGIFSADEQKLLVHTNETGIFNLYEINISDGSKKALTNSSTESFFAIDYVPGSGEVLTPLTKEATKSATSIS